MQRRTLLKSTAAALSAGLAMPHLRAQTLPTGNVRIVVGFPPGGWHRRLGTGDGGQVASHVECERGD
jgi:hypothetical protein